MLELLKITKIYQTEGLKQRALDEVTLNFRPSEFVAILGPSGSGKTTLLNIIGGLDKYDSGDLKINEVSTKDFRDRDWDAYRNHRVGFVFQAYNLIAHQTVLSNVELALTLSGVSRRERVRRAKKALAEVGLEKHIYKRPAQLSGGQAQRVAIARALINDPDILLADEPTGALDSETSEQIMKLLKRVSENRLVIMVTHNPELAKEYATRTVKLKDGRIIADSRPYDGREDTREALEIERKKSKKTAMGLGTALALSFNNLRTKLGRTILTAFAGSIGIIGIALILSLSHGIQAYIDRTEAEALANYPITINKNTLDVSSLIGALMGVGDGEAAAEGEVKSADVMGSVLESLSGEAARNDLVAFRKYLESDEGARLRDLTLGVEYSWDIVPEIYLEKDGELLQANPTTIFSAMGMNYSMNAAYGGVMSNYDVFVPVADDYDGNLREVLARNYELVAGEWPRDWRDMVIAVSSKRTIADYSLYSMQVMDQRDLAAKFMGMVDGQKVQFAGKSYSYDELMGLRYKVKMADGRYEELRISGIAEVEGLMGVEMGGVAYTQGLIMELAKAAGKDLGDPDKVMIYPKDFDAKKEISRLIDEYNAGLPEDAKLTYTDTVGVLMGSVSTIVDVVSSVLIAFVAISLIVSSIMIAIITYVSVLERTKEIGILRAIGARKRDISRVFNAETLIEGLAAGLLGIGVTLLLLIPANLVIEAVTGIAGLAVLPVTGAVVLIAISMLLTVVAGLIPARIASRKDPVEALRSE